MQIPSYQISNVIKVYSKQLSQSRMLNRQENQGAPPGNPVDKIRISPEGKKQTIINKISDDVFSRITKYGPQDSKEQEIVDKLKKEIKKNQGNTSDKDNKFVFNFIGDDNIKVTNEISIEGSKFIGNRLEELVKDTIDK